MPTTRTDPRPPTGPEPPTDVPAVAEVVAAVKPRLRGWLHAGAAPLALAAGIVLVALAPTTVGVVGGAVFLAASVLLFGTSGLYHRGTPWGSRTEAVLRRLDHANIYVFIAATYTPLALIMLEGTSRVALLIVVWVAAVGGCAFRLFWLSAPRRLYVALYVLMGWAALGWLGAFYAAAGLPVLILILAGGLCYTVGAVVYGRKRPDPWPAWFGFHEIFHACTLAGFACHYVAISLVTYAAS